MTRKKTAKRKADEEAALLALQYGPVLIIDGPYAGKVGLFPSELSEMQKRHEAFWKKGAWKDFAA